MTTHRPDPFQDALLLAVPHLRVVARALCRHADRADDLVQETLLKAWDARETLLEQECLKPWLQTILRNIYYRSATKRRREVEDIDGSHAATLVASPTQDTQIELNEVMRAFECLPAEQREALVLVCIQDLSHEEAASICGCAVGTIKSRVHRGRETLKHILGRATANERTLAPAMKASVAPTTRERWPEVGGGGNRHSGLVACPG